MVIVYTAQLHIVFKLGDSVRKIVYGLLCLLGDPRFLTYDGAKWTLAEEIAENARFTGLF